MMRCIKADLPEEGLPSRVTVLCAGRAAQEPERLRVSGVVDRPIGGRRRRGRMFVMVLATSRLIVVRPVLAMDRWALIECHVEAIRVLRRRSKSLVPDTGATESFAAICSADSPRSAHSTSAHRSGTSSKQRRLTRIFVRALAPERVNCSSQPFATQYNRGRECRICLSDVGNVQITVVATVTSST
jgi:hypothetical protein